MTLFTYGCESPPEVVVGHGEAADSEDPEASSSPSDDGDDTGEDDGSQTFVPDNDWTPLSTCDPFAQDCEPGFKCVPYSAYGGTWDANKCVPVLGKGDPGDPCTYDGPTEATDSCGETSMCWNFQEVDGELFGTCIGFCTGRPDEPMCPPGSHCSISCAGTLSVCIPSCDPIAQDCLGLGCYWTSSSFECVFTTQDIELGEPCDYINDCRPGLGCVTADVMPSCEGSACCAEFCDLRNPVCNQEGTACSSWFEDGTAPPEYEHVGICILPTD